MDIRAKLLSQSTVIFGARIAGAAFVFLTQAAIARFWGSEILGEYVLVIASVNMLAMIMPLGFHSVGTYFAAEYSARGQGDLLWRFLLQSYAQAGGMALVLTALLASLVRFLPAEHQFAASLWLPIAIMAAATALIFVNSSILVGLKRPFAGYFADGLFRPLLIFATLSLVMLAGGSGENLAQVIWNLSAGYAAIALAQAFWVVRSVRNVPVVEPSETTERKRWWRYAMPWLLIALATDFLFDFDLLLLSSLMDKESLAIFGVCTRMFSLAAFGVTAVYAVSLPDIFESEAKSDRAEFLRKVGDANLVAAGLAAAMFVGASFVGPFVLLLFGPEFAGGAGALSVLCLVLVVRAVFGPASLVLSIHDRPWASLPAIIASLGVLVLANFALVPAFGLMGAALSALLAIGVWSASLWMVAKNTVSIDVSIFPRLTGPQHQGRSETQNVQ